MPKTRETVRGAWRRLAGYGPLILIPLAVVLLSFWLKAVQGPYWLARNQDPAYAYFMNSLLLVEFQPPVLVEHPGTPLEILGAGVIWVMHLFRGTSSISEDALRNPELYLAGFHLTLSILYGLVLLIVGVLVLRITGSKTSAFVMQLTPLFSRTILQELSNLRPERLLICFAVLFSVAILAWLWRAPKKEERKGGYLFALLFGALVGMGLAVKVTFLPLALAPLILLPGWRSRVMYVFTAPVTFLVCVIPALPTYRRFVSWITQIVTHTGRYGSGERGLFDLGNLPRLWPILVEEVFFSLLLVALATALAWLWRRGQTTELPERFRRWPKGLFAIGLVGVAQLVMIMKHPNNHYLVPALCTAGLGLVLLVELSKLWSKRMRRIGLVVVVLLAALLVQRDFHLISVHRREHAKIAEELFAVRRAMQGRFATARKVYYYRSSSQEYALAFGEAYTKGYFSVRLRKLYPDFYYYIGWRRKQYRRFGEEVSLTDIASDDVEVVFQGLPFTRDIYPGDLDLVIPKGAILELVVPGKHEVIYRLKAIQSDLSAPGEIEEGSSATEDETADL